MKLQVFIKLKNYTLKSPIQCLVPFSHFIFENTQSQEVEVTSQGHPASSFHITLQTLLMPLLTQAPSSPMAGIPPRSITGNCSEILTTTHMLALRERKRESAYMLFYSAVTAHFFIKIVACVSTISLFLLPTFNSIYFQFFHHILRVII